VLASGRQADPPGEAMELLRFALGAPPLDSPAPDCLPWSTGRLSGPQVWTLSSRSVMVASLGWAA
jgi:hypothetical protein